MVASGQTQSSVKERPQWLGARGPDGRQRWVNAADLRPASRQPRLCRRFESSPNPCSILARFDQQPRRTTSNTAEDLDSADRDREPRHGWPFTVIKEPVFGLLCIAQVERNKWGWGDSLLCDIGKCSSNTGLGPAKGPACGCCSIWCLLVPVSSSTPLPPAGFGHHLPDESRASFRGPL